MRGGDSDRMIHYPTLMYISLYTQYFKHPQAVTPPRFPCNTSLLKIFRFRFAAYRLSNKVPTKSPGLIHASFLLNELQCLDMIKMS